MTDEYLHEWKAANGYFEIVRPGVVRWMSDEECDRFEEEKRAWLESRRGEPTTEYGWKKLFGLLAPHEAKRLDKDEVRERVDFKAVLEETLRLQVRGDRAVAKCPFHDDRLPSFAADLKRKVWTCHAGCGGGDLFSFVMKRDDLTFTEAIRALDERA